MKQKGVKVALAVRVTKKMIYEKPKISYKAVRANTSLDAFLEKKKEEKKVEG